MQTPLESQYDVRMSGKLLLIYMCNFHVLNHLLLIYICKLHWNLQNYGRKKKEAVQIAFEEALFENTTLPQAEDELRLRVLECRDQMVSAFKKELGPFNKYSSVDIVIGELREFASRKEKDIFEDNKEEWYVISMS